MTNYYEEHAGPLLALGYEPIPLTGKRPIQSNWVQIPVTPESVETNNMLFADNNVGIRTGEVCALDVDVTDAKVAKALYTYIGTLGLEHVRVRFGAMPKFLIPFRSPDPLRRKMVSSKWTDKGGNFHIVEVLGKGQQFVAQGMHPDTKKEYKWQAGRDLVSTSMDVQDLPLYTMDVHNKIVNKFYELASAAGWMVSGQDSPLQGDTPASSAAEAPPIDMDFENIKKLLVDLFPHKCMDWERYDDWLQLGMALHHQFNGDPEGLALWDMISTDLGNYNPNELEAKWDSFHTDRGTNVTLRTLIKQGKECGVNVVTVGADDFPDLEDCQQNEPKKGWIVNLKDAQKAKAPPSIIKGLLGFSQTLGITAKTKTGKSLFALEMAKCVITAEDFFTLPIRSPGAVMYLSYEGDESITQRCLSLFSNSKHADLLFSKFRHGRPPKRLDATDENSMVHVLGKVMKDFKASVGELPRVIILDTLAASTDMDENSSKEMGNLTSTIRRFTSHYNIGFVYVHHSTKSGTQFRGHSSLEGDVDGIVEIDKNEGTGNSVARVAAHRWYVPPMDMHYKAEHIPTGRMDEDGDIEEAPVLVPVVGVEITKTKAQIWVEDALAETFNRIGNTVLESDELSDFMKTWETESGLNTKGFAKVRAEVLKNLESGNDYKIYRNGAKRLEGVQQVHPHTPLSA